MVILMYDAENVEFKFSRLRKQLKTVLRSSEAIEGYELRSDFPKLNDLGELNS